MGADAAVDRNRRGRAGAVLRPPQSDGSRSRSQSGGIFSCYFRPHASSPCASPQGCAVLESRKRRTTSFYAADRGGANRGERVAHLTRDHRTPDLIQAATTCNHGIAMTFECDQSIDVLARTPAVLQCMLGGL